MVTNLYRTASLSDGRTTNQVARLGCVCMYVCARARAGGARARGTGALSTVDALEPPIFLCLFTYARRAHGY